jgi:membrane associated rhomboid family serine protease
VSLRVSHVGRGLVVRRPLLGAPTCLLEGPHLLPIRDDNPTRNAPVMTWVLLIALAVVWFLVQGAGDPEILARSVCNLGLVPGELTHRAALGTGVQIGDGLACLVDADPINWLTPLTSMFLHGGWLHLLGNALFLYIFGDNIEDSLGRTRFLVFYIVCGLAAAVAQIAIHPASPVPMVGASGAISGVLGAYLRLYPRARVQVLVFVFIIAVPAWLMLIYWFGLQLLEGLPQLKSLDPSVSSGVAVWAHVGGFVTGFVLVGFFARPAVVERRRTSALRGR